LASFNSSISSKYVGTAVAVLSGAVTIIQSLNAFLEYNTKYDGHFNCAIKFITLARMIETEVYVNYYNYKQTTSDEDHAFTKNLLTRIQKEFLAIQGTEPYIPYKIQNKTYKNVKCGTSDIDDALFELNDENGLVNRADLNIDVFDSYETKE
jgi:hypothetical protein